MDTYAIVCCIGLLVIILLFVILGILLCQDSQSSSSSSFIMPSPAAITGSIMCSPYHWNTHECDDSMSIDPPDTFNQRFSLGPNFLTQLNTSTGWTGASEYYLMPMDGVMKDWCINMDIHFTAVPYASFPIQLSLKAIKATPLTGGTGYTGSEYLLMTPVEVNNSSECISVCAAFTESIPFHKLDRFSVVADMHFSSTDPDHPFIVFAERLNVSCMAFWDTSGFSV